MSNKSVKYVRKQFLSERNLVEKGCVLDLCLSKTPSVLALQSARVDKDANDYKAEEVTVLSEPFAQHFDAKYLTQQSLNSFRWEGFISEV